MEELQKVLVKVLVIVNRNLGVTTKDIDPAFTKIVSKEFWNLLI